MKKMTLLTFVETFPNLEDEIRTYDEAAGCCLLCTCLFDTLDDIEKNKKIDLSKLIKKAENLLGTRDA